jgi:hypothetical protein
VPDTLYPDTLIPFLDEVGMEQEEGDSPEVVEEVGLSAVDVVGDGELDLLATPPMLRPIHHMLLILQVTVNHLPRRRKNIWRMSWLP